MSLLIVIIFVLFQFYCFTVFMFQCIDLLLRHTINILKKSIVKSFLFIVSEYKVGSYNLIYVSVKFPVFQL